MLRRNCVRRGQAEALLLGPLAVDPFFNGKGIGSALMNHAIEEAKRLEHAAIILVGDAAYYKRFGFSAEKTGELFMPGPFEKARLLALGTERWRSGWHERRDLCDGQKSCCIDSTDPKGGLVCQVSSSVLHNQR